MSNKYQSMNNEEYLNTNHFYIDLSFVIGSIGMY